MKIVYLSNSSIPSKTANSVHVMKMSQALAYNDNEVVLISKIDYRTYLEIDDIYDFYGVEDNFKLIRVKSKAVKLISSFLYGIKTSRIAKKQTPDLVYTRDLLGAFFLSTSGTKVIYECHSPNFSGFKKMIFKHLIRNKNVKKIVVISKALKDALVEKYVNNEYVDKLIVAHDGVDFERYRDLPDTNSCREIIKEDKDAKLIGYVGHLYKGRGIELILNMANILKEYRFILVGGNESDIERVLGIIKEEKITNVALKGFVPNKEIVNYLCACDVLLMPYQKKVSVDNKGDTSAFMSPLKLFEYLASNTPIVSSDLPVLSEVLKHETNAMLADPENVNEWTAHIDEIMNNETLNAFLRQNQKQDVEKYSWTNRCRDILEQVGD